MWLNVVKMEHLKFQNSKMAPAWKAVDQDYKFLAVFENSTTTFSFDTDPPGVSLPADLITWSGSALPFAVSTSLDNRQIDIRFTNSGRYVIRVDVAGCSRQATTEVIARPSGYTETEIMLLYPVETWTAVCHNLIGTNPATLEPSIWAAATYPGIQHNTIADAARHAYWNTLLARYCGHAYAYNLTTGHEVSGLTPSTPATETCMDMKNNLVGRGLQLHTHGPDYSCCRNAVTAAVTAGDLYYLDGSYGVQNVNEGALLQPTDK